MKQKKEKRDYGKSEIDKWKSQRENDMKGRQKSNEDEQYLYLKNREDARNSKNPWEKVINNIDLKENPS